MRRAWNHALSQACVEPQLRNSALDGTLFIGLFQGSIGGAPVLGTHALPGFQPAGPDPA